MASRLQSALRHRRAGQATREPISRSRIVAGDQVGDLAVAVHGAESIEGLYMSTRLATDINGMSQAASLLTIGPMTSLARCSAQAPAGAWVRQVSTPPPRLARGRRAASSTWQATARRPAAEPCSPSAWILTGQPPLTWLAVGYHETFQ
jgi:hypothetical protein